MLDTRSKILDEAEARAALAGRTVVAAYFDPFVAAHADRLRELAEEHGRLAVCICEPPDPLLPARARAELAAACRDVDAVAIGERHLAAAARILDERDADQERRAELMRHVHRRQKAAGNG